MSLFGDYIKERGNREILEEEYGFVTYVFSSKEECYLEDMYIVPKYRRQKYASKLADKLFVIAKEHGMKSVYTTVVPSTNGSNESLAGCLQYGFKLLKTEPNLIYLIKEV